MCCISGRTGIFDRVIYSEGGGEFMPVTGREGARGERTGQTEWASYTVGKLVGLTALVRDERFCLEERGCWNNGGQVVPN